MDELVYILYMHHSKLLTDPTVGMVTLFDVHFSKDSILERVAHACHFGVMVALAAVGPLFDDTNNISLERSGCYR